MSYIATGCADVPLLRVLGLRIIMIRAMVDAIMIAMRTATAPPTIAAMLKTLDGRAEKLLCEV